MKKLISLTVLIALLSSCTMEQEKGYVINGSIEGISDGKVYVVTRKEGAWVNLDSATIAEGIFQLKGSVDFPVLYSLQFEGIRGAVPVFFENADISVTGKVEELGEAKIVGSEAQAEFNAYMQSIDKTTQQKYDIYALYRKAKEAEDAELSKSLEKEMDDLEKEEKEFIINYAMENNKSVVSAYLIRRNSWMFDLEELESLTDNFDQSLDASDYVSELKARVKILTRVAVGKPAVGFTMNDTSGNPVSLSSFKGKYLLVDFWAYGCAPCRAENPNVVAMYQLFKDQGFDVLGVSFDTEKEQWMAAIHEDNLTWTHVSDLQGWGNAAGKIYGINSIPSNVLLDPEQTIIAKNLRGDDLNKKLEEIFRDDIP